MSITATTVFYRWSQPISLDLVLERVSLFGRRLGLRWGLPPGKSDLGCDSEAASEGRFVVNCGGFRHPLLDRFLLSTPLDWEFARACRSFWKIDWLLVGDHLDSKYYFNSNNTSEFEIVPTNGADGTVLWIRVHISGEIRFDGDENEEARRRLEERYHSLKMLFRLLECDEAIAAGAFDEIPPDGHSNCFFHLQRSGVQVLLERFETDETRAVAIDAYDGKLVLPPEALPHILSAAEIEAGEVE